MFFVYCIYNELRHKIYIGQTVNLELRLAEHNNPLCNKHRFTQKIGAGWKIIYVERQPTRKEALIREKQLKSYRGRQYIKQFIHSPLTQW